jgi:hypothetical protein
MPAPFPRAHPVRRFPTSPLSAVLIAAVLVLPVFAADPAPEPAAAITSAGAVPVPEPPRRLLPERPLSHFDFRIFHASPGKLDALHARLRDHQIPLLEQHRILTLAVFVPAGENPQQVVCLVTAAEDLHSLIADWADFRRDPKWHGIVAETDRDGRLVAAESFQRLIRTYWSPRFPPATPVESGIYELRTYNCPDASRQNALKIRFRNHTMRLFEKHGMRNLVYWVPDEPPASQQQLVYLLGHESQEAAEESFAAFRQDPEWLAVKEASEKPFVGPLTVENGIQSQFLVPTEYSPLK